MRDQFSFFQIMVSSNYYPLMTLHRSLEHVILLARYDYADQVIVITL